MNNPEEIRPVKYEEDYSCSEEAVAELVDWINPDAPTPSIEDLRAYGCDAFPTIGRCIPGQYVQFPQNTVPPSGGDVPVVLSILPESNERLLGTRPFQSLVHSVVVVGETPAGDYAVLSDGQKVEYPKAKLFSEWQKAGSKAFIPTPEEQ